MLWNPIAHYHVMSGSSNDDGWVWLCTGNGYRYVNFDADNTEPPPDSPPELRSPPCCLYDAAPESEFVFVRPNQTFYYLAELSFYQLPPPDLFTHYSSRAPPFIIS